MARPGHALEILSWASLVAVIAMVMVVPVGLAQPDHVPRQVILKFKSGVVESDKDDFLSRLQARTLRVLPRSHIHHLQLTDLTVDEVLRQYRDDPRLAYIEPNYIVPLVAVPNDPQFHLLWNFANDGQTGGTPGVDINAIAAWDLVAAAPDVLVAVVDSGVDYIHEDLAANIYLNPGEIADNGIDDDGNGFIDDIRGWNFSADNNNPKDTFGHGTSIAGIIGAVGNNGIGVVGLAWDVNILPVKWAQGFTGDLAAVLAATEYATQMGVDIMNHSWGEHFATPPTSLLEVFQDANDAGILLVCAAGNEGQDVEVTPFYPASFDLPNIVAVAASDHNDDLPMFSNYGSISIDLAAPGAAIHSTLINDGYGLFGVGGPFLPGSGTSFAAPHVTGALALMQQHLPELTPQELKQRLLNTVDLQPLFAGTVLSGGRLDLNQALLGPDVIPPAAVNDLAAQEVASNWIQLGWTASGDDGLEGVASAYDLRYATFPLDASNFALAVQVAGEPLPAQPGTAQQMQVVGLELGTLYYFAMKVLDERSNESSLSNVVNQATLGAPVVAVEPESFSVSLDYGEVQTHILTVSNQGVGTLDFQLTTNASWLIPVPAAGFLYPGNSQDITLTLNAAGLCAPDYLAEVVLASNDPVQPSLQIPVQLSVTGAPEIDVAPADLDFGIVYVGLDSTDSFTVSNIGCLSLTVADIQCDNPDFSLEPVAFSLAPGGSQVVTTVFGPAGPGPVAAEVTISSDDPMQPLLTIDLHGEGLLPPIIGVDQDTLMVDIPSGGIQSVPLVITNAGGSDLNYEVRFEDDPGMGMPGQLCRPIRAAVLDSHGADYETDTWDHLNQYWSLYGEVAIDIDYTSLNRLSITYADIVASGADALIIANAKDASLGWEFSNGELEAIRYYTEQGHGLFVTAGTLNDAHVPNNSTVLAPLLGLREDETYQWALHIPGPMIILAPDHPLFAGIEIFYQPAFQFTAYSGGGDWLTAVDSGEVLAISVDHRKAVIAHGNRSYISAPPEEDSQTTDFQFIYNAIRHGATGPATWLSGDQPAGTIPAGESATLNLVMGGEGLCGGDYVADLVLVSNDILTPERRILCQMHMGGAPVIGVTPVALEFGELFVGSAAEDSLILTNSGTVALDVTAITSDNGQFVVEPASLQVGIGESRTVRVTFDPAIPGEHEGILTLHSNDPVNPTVVVNVHGVSFTAPVIEVEPASLSEFLPVGLVAARHLVLQNSGGSDLIFASEAVPMEAGDESLKSTGFLVYSDDMEQGGGGWTKVVMAGEDLWHQTQSESHSPVTSWWCGRESSGDYNTGGRVYTALVSPSIGLLFYGGPYRLKFYENIDTQPGNDRCMVDFSLDGGETWSPLRGGASGNSGGWFETNLLVPDLGNAGAVRFRFLFDTGDGILNNYPGWFVDDVRLVAEASIWLDISPSEGTVPAGETLDLTVFFDTNNLEPGLHEMMLGLQSNDPAQPIFQIPVSLTVYGENPVVEISTTAGIHLDEGDLLGILPDATDGYDPAHDIPELEPPPSDYVTGYFYNPDWEGTSSERFARDIRALFDPGQDTRGWWFAVETDQIGSVQLQFTPSFLASTGWQLHLRDSVSGIYRNLFSGPTYVYNQATPGVRLFEIVLGQPLPALQPTSRLLPSGLSLVGVPLVPPPGTETWQDVLLADASGEVSLFGYGGSGEYQAVMPADTVQQGKGVWIDTALDFTWSQVGVRDLDGVLVPIRNGWNLVGYPLWTEGALGGLYVDQAGERLSHAEAVAAGLISSVIFSYDTNTGIAAPGVSLLPWHGYWFASFGDDLALWFDVRQLAAGGGGILQPGNKVLPDWQVSVHVVDGAGSITFGTLNGASLEFDAAWDLPKPPAPPGGPTQASIGLYRPEWDLNTGDLFWTDLVDRHRLPRAWRALVSRPTPGTVTLSWDGSVLPPEIDLSLVQLDRDSVVVSSLRHASLTQLAVGVDPLPIAFEVQVPDDDDLHPGLHLHNVPNPSNPATEFRFVLDRGGQAEIRIYNVRGALVARIEGGVLPAGEARLRWFGRDRRGALLASGTYFYRLYLDGHLLGSTCKLSLLR